MTDCVGTMAYLLFLPVYKISIIA